MSLETGPWLARVNLMLTQAPGSIPSTLRIRAGEVFCLDGDEGFDLAMAQKLGQVVAYDADVPQPELLQKPTPLPPPRRRRNK